MTQRVMYLTGVETLELRHDPIPEPGPGEILIAVVAATTCGTDVKVFRRGGHPRMLKVPTPFGHEFAGTVRAVGAGVDRFALEDRVVVANSAPCGACRFCAADRENLCEDLEYLNGGFAEYVLVPARFVEKNCYHLRAETAFEIASLAEPLACVLHGLDACELEGSRDVVLYGAGPIGLLFVGALHALGHRVTMADPNENRLEVARQLGADQTECIVRGGGQADQVRKRAADALGFDVAIDASGVPEVWLDAIESVRPGGLVNLFGGCAPGTQVPLDTHRVHYSEITLKGVYHHRPETFRRALDMLETDAFDAALLLSDKVSLEDLESGLRMMMDKRALKVVVSPNPVD